VPVVEASCRVGRTLLSAAFDLDSYLCKPRMAPAFTRQQSSFPKIKINYKGGGAQECPPYTTTKNIQCDLDVKYPVR
jgi:hypothetical protein